VDRQEVGVALVIPAGFTDRYLSGDYDTQVQIVSDPTLSIGPAVVEDMVTTMIDAVAGGGIAVLTLQERQQALGLAPDPAALPAYIEQYGNWYRDFERALYHDPERAALVVSAPAAGAEAVDPFRQTMALTLAGQMIFFAFFTGSYAMLSIVRDAEEGTLARLFTTPTSTTTILAGKYVAVVLTVVLQGLVLLTAGHYAFGIDWGPPAGVAVALTAQVVAATGLGVALIALIKGSRQAGPVLGGGLTVLGMLGGLFTANIPGGMPAAFNVLANFTPQGWVLKAWRGVLDGAPMVDLLVPLAVAVTIGLALFVVGAALFRRRYQ
jgi:ABC-2 type transport system permease protein